MKKNLTELVFILDRSGSMSGLEEDTIGGFNSMLERQRSGEGEVLVTTVLFDDRYELLHDRLNAKDLGPLTSKDYYVRGTTALLDAMGRTMNRMIGLQKKAHEEEKADQVVFVIITDGMENASREYSIDKIRKMIGRQKEEYKWEFLFLGANIDAVSVAKDYGIDKDRAVSYHADRKGTRLNYQVISETLADFRFNRTIRDDWKEEIEKDYSSRKKE